ncbi:MAG: NADH-quinone oxidoreductase subunit G [Micavibrio sp.]|nr:NADH-quinone oxidoreductase subunit G [Micavibrio sp.]
MPKLTIDGHEIEVEAGTSIIQAAEQLGIEIPRFCYHDKLSVPANCRMCLVEVSPGPPKPQASCALACGEGMVVQTQSEMVKKARKGVMEFLLINHPLDCPICDQGGECDLQDQSVAYGFDRSRYTETKRAVKNKNIGPLIKTIMTRCIQCTRCVRFGEEVAGMNELGLLNRGENVEIGTFIETAVSTELSGNMIDICPVGALTSAPYTFTARPWELKKTETIDVMDAVGSNIRVDSRGNEVMRVLPRLNEDVNEEWISDKTRFAYDGLKYQRLDRPYIRKDGKLTAVSWDEALAFTAAKLKGVDGKEIAAVAGDLVDVESVVALKDLMKGLGSSHMDCRPDGTKFEIQSRADYLFNTGIADIEQADAILLIGTDPRHEAPLINARIRKTWLQSKVKVGLIGTPVELTYPYEHIGTSPEDLESLTRARSGFAKILKDAKNPVVIVGTGALRHTDGYDVHALAKQYAMKIGAGFNVLHVAAGRVGALDVGFVPQKGGYDIFKMVNAGKKDKLKAVYLLGVDELDTRAAFGTETFMIYQGHHGDNGARHADVIFPGAAYTEKNALYVNTEGRVQQAKRAVFPVGDAKEDWTILRALSEKMGKTLPYNTHQELRNRIFKEFPHLAQLNTKPIEALVASEHTASVGNKAFQRVVTNFYQTDPISRASVTMTKCVEAFIAADQPMLDAAE